MERQTLQQILESDRELLTAGLARDRSPEAAQAALEKQLDRMIYRYAEQCPDARLRDAGQYILQTMKNALPLLDCVSEARQWNRTLPDASKKRRVRPAALGLLAAGAALILASSLGAQLFSGRTLALVPAIRSALAALLGTAGVFWAGRLSAAPEKKKNGPEPETRTEFLIDEARVWHRLHGMMLLADSALDSLSENLALEAQATSASGAEPPRGQIELLSNLLETAYAYRGTPQDEDAREAIAGIGYYLHGQSIDLVDYGAGAEQWFELLPSPNPGTIRPALVSEGRLIRKGMASV